MSKQRALPFWSPDFRSIDHLVCKVYVSRSLSEDPSLFGFHFFEFNEEDTALECYSKIYETVKRRWGKDAVVPGTLAFKGKTVLSGRDFRTEHWRRRRTLRDWDLQSGDVLHWIPFESTEVAMEAFKDEIPPDDKF
jgi:hypothetical protein